jgi:DNA-directed RNA polymerase subunit F
MKSEYVEDVTLLEIKKILTEKAKSKELNFEQKQSLEHAKTFVNITPANSEKLKIALKEQFSLSDEVATKLTDITPNSIELDLILEKEKNYNEEDKPKILEIINKYRKE